MTTSGTKGPGSKVARGPINWNKRFIRSLKINGKQTYIIADYRFWMNNQVELENWLIDNTKDGVGTQEGMTLNFCNEQEELMFKLRWE